MGWLQERKLKKIIKEINGMPEVKIVKGYGDILEKVYEIDKKEVGDIYILLKEKPELEDVIFHAVSKAKVEEDISFLCHMLKSEKLERILRKYGGKIELIKNLLKKMYDVGYDIETVDKIYSKILRGKYGN